MQDKQQKKTNLIAYFFRQTFRRHTGEEYSELLTRGLKKDDGANRQYPWAYIRLFGLLFTLYAVFLLIIRFTGNELLSPTVVLLASVCFNLPFLVLLYELYPNKDLNFTAVVLAMLIGGTLAQILTQALYNLFSAPNDWLSAVYAGFFEELPKAAATVIVIVISKKRSPLAGFVLGAAIGCGFSVVEDMGYIFVYSNEMPYMNLTSIIEISISRGVTAFCTHTLWTAAVGWAYCFFERKLANAAFYLVLIFSCGLHILWDLPISSEVALGFLQVGCALTAGVECIAILYKGRKKVFKINGAERPDDSYYIEDAASSDVKTYEYWNHWGRVAVAISTFLMAVIAVCYCSVPFRETYGTEVFTSPSEFVYFMQNGMEFDIEENRAYNKFNTASDYVQEIEDPNGANIETRVQYVTDENYPNEKFDCTVTYNYSYTSSYDFVSDRNYYTLNGVTVTVTNADGSANTYIEETVYTKSGTLYASFFRTNTDVVVTGYNLENDDSITVFIYDADFVRNLLDPQYTWLFITFGTILGAATIVYGALKIKAWRVKKLCSTKNVSSVK